jgi:hypothetical protein
MILAGEAWATTKHLNFITNKQLLTNARNFPIVANVSLSTFAER